MADITVKTELMQIANDINTEGWAETLAGIIFGDEQMKVSGIKKREISYEMIACLQGDVLPSY